MAESSIYDSVVEESAGGMTRRVYSCDMPPPTSARRESERCGQPRKQKTVTDEHVAELLCALAVERRENESLRKYNEWLTQRVQTLELQLTRN